MASTIASGANFYDMLGVAPSASEEQIRGAFAREMGMFRPMTETARIGLAFETLRNPAKRRAYDQALGLIREPPPAPKAVSFRMSGRFVGAAATERRMSPVGEVMVQPAAEKPLPATPDPAPKRAQPAFIAATSASAAVAPEPTVQSEPPLVERDPEPDLERLIGQLQGLRKSSEQTFANTKFPEIRWNSTAATIGGLVLATVFVGVWAGTHAGDAEPPAAQAAASVALPPAKPVAKSEGATPAAQVNADAERPAAFVPAERRRIPTRRTQLASSNGAAGATGASQTAGPDAADAQAAADPLAPAPSPAAVVTEASLPLPDNVIARTIERIGYSCGRVASRTAGASAGSYKITCTSGQSYQAKAVRGRYHFRRLSSR